MVPCTAPQRTYGALRAEEWGLLLQNDPLGELSHPHVSVSTLCFRATPRRDTHSTHRSQCHNLFSVAVSFDTELARAGGSQGDKGWGLQKH